jgi:hypothetical protein
MDFSLGPPIDQERSECTCVVIFPSPKLFRNPRMLLMADLHDNFGQLVRALGCK